MSGSKGYIGRGSRSKGSVVKLGVLAPGVSTKKTALANGSYASRKPFGDLTTTIFILSGSMP